MNERINLPSEEEITRPSLRIYTEPHANLDENVSRKYYSEIMVILDRVKLNSKSYNEVDGVPIVSGKIFTPPSKISERAKSIFGKHRIQPLDLNFIYGEEYRSIELLNKDVKILFILDKKNKTCSGVRRGILVNGVWKEEKVNGIPFNDALILARLGEEF